MEKISNSELYKAIRKIKSARLISNENIMELNALVAARKDSDL